MFDTPLLGIVIVDELPSLQFSFVAIENETDAVQYVS